MFVVIKNERSNIINTLVVNTVKTMVGEFTRDDIERELNNVVYDGVIVDLTAIKNYYDYNYLFSFLEYFRNPSDIIILLNDSFIANSKDFLEKLISKGYYNFATTDSGVNSLIERKNTFEDVSKYLNGYDFLKVDSIVSDKEIDNKFESDKIIVGIENGVPHSGATTLMYMLVKQISKYNSVKGIEMFKDDSLYFKDDRVVTCQSRAQFETIISSLKDVDIFIVDLNGSDVRNLCNKIIYLVEPGASKINKVVKGDRDTYNKLVNSYVVLNRSNIKNEDIGTFEYETKFKVVGNIPNLNERLDSNDALDGLVKYLVGDIKRNKGGFWNLFKRDK